MPISPYRELQNSSLRHGGRRAFWGGFGMALLGSLIIASHFAVPATGWLAAKSPSTAAQVATQTSSIH